jgi:hypothetical protein
MSVATSQTLVKYYERYKGIDVTFTKEVIKATGLVTQQVYIKCFGETWPCVIYSASFMGARIIINTKSTLLDHIQKANNLVSLRFSFRDQSKSDPVMFFVSARAAGHSAYGSSPDVAMLSIAFTQRPPDDLIEVIGRMLDANMNSAKRRDDRVLLTPDVMRKLGIASKETVMFIQNVPRRCILRDVSFSGAKVIMVGVAKFLINREASLRLDFEEPRESLLIKTTVVRSEDVEGRKDLTALALQFDEAAVPMSFKMRINDFLSQVRSDPRGEGASGAT